MDLTSTLSAVEALWIVMGVICLPATIRSWWRALGNRRALYTLQAVRAQQGRPPLPAGYGVSADLDIRWRGVAVGIQAVLLLLGVRAAFLPPLTTPLTWDAWVAGAAFLAMQGVLMWAAWRNDAAEVALARTYRAAMPVDPNPKGDPDGPDSSAEPTVPYDPSNTQPLSPLKGRKE